MRLAPVALRFFKNYEECLAHSRTSSLTTHPGILAERACEFLSHLIIRALEREDVRD